MFNGRHVLDFYAAIAQMDKAGAKGTACEVYTDPERYPHRTIAVFALRAGVNWETASEMLGLWLAHLADARYLDTELPTDWHAEAVPDGPDK